MTEEVKNDAPEAMRRIVMAMTTQAVARCDRLGIAREDFLKALVAEQCRHPDVTVTELFDLTFARLEAAAN